MARSDSRSQFSVPITGLEERVYDLSFRADVSDCGLTGFVGTIAVEGDLSHVGSQYRIDATIDASLKTECDRCLEPVERPMQASLQVVFERSPTAIEDDGDIRPLGEEESSIVLDDAIRDAVLLARPLKNLCREDCAGLCPSCGTDLNTKHCACQNETVDPRWSALAALREGKEK